LFGKLGRNKVFILRQENNHINIEYSAKIYINFGNKILKVLKDFKDLKTEYIAATPLHFGSLWGSVFPLPYSKIPQMWYFGISAVDVPLQP
jgi:hypothetical protein